MDHSAAPSSVKHTTVLYLQAAVVRCFYRSSCMLTASGLRFKTVLPGLTTSFFHTPPSQAVDLILFFLFPCPVKLPILLKISWMHFLSGLGMDDFTDLKFPPYCWVFSFFFLIELVHCKDAAWCLGCRTTTFFF